MAKRSSDGGVFMIKPTTELMDSVNLCDEGGRRHVLVAVAFGQNIEVGEGLTIVNSSIHASDEGKLFKLHHAKFPEVKFGNPLEKWTVEKVRQLAQIRVVADDSLPKAYVDISAELLTEILKGLEGGSPRKFIVTNDPIPPDAKFKQATATAGGNVRVWFESEHVKNGQRIVPSLTVERE